MAEIALPKLQELLEYDPYTGELRWLTDGKTGRRKGAVAGYVDKRGYRLVYIEGRLYMAHRLAWLLFFLEWPKRDLRHLNGVRTDNRIGNLEEYSEREFLAKKRYFGQRSVETS